MVRKGPGSGLDDRYCLSYLSRTDSIVNVTGIVEFGGKGGMDNLIDFGHLESGACLAFDPVPNYSDCSRTFEQRLGIGVMSRLSFVG